MSIRGPLSESPAPIACISVLVRIPRVDPVGLVEQPVGYVASPRAYSARLRLVAAMVLAAFAAVGVATTVWSLGAYCLTSHAGAPFGFTP